MRTHTIGVAILVLSILCGGYGTTLLLRAANVRALHSSAAVIFAPESKQALEGFLAAASSTGCSPSVISMLREHRAQTDTLIGVMNGLVTKVERAYFVPGVVLDTLCLALALSGIALVRRNDSAT